jgi:hypothetical protein
MQTGQLRRLIESFAEFAATVGGPSVAVDISKYASILPSEGKQTSAQFVAHLRRSLSKGASFECPPVLWARLKAIEASLSLVSAGAGADIKALVSVLEASPSATLDEFFQRMSAARDFVPPAKIAKPKAAPKVDAVVANYVERLRNTASVSKEFERVLSSLLNDRKVSDTRVKKISKELWGRTAKSREEAFSHIQAFHRREALSASSNRTLEMTSV